MSCSNAKNIEINDINNLEIIHSKSKGYITLASKNEQKFTQWHYKINELEDRYSELIDKKVNVYISHNTFYKPQRRIENIKELNAIFIDIDCYNTDYTKEAVKFFIEKDLNGIIPNPTMLVDSGRGLYYVLKLEPVPNKALPLWYAIQRYIYNQLKEFGADAKALDPTRVLRATGTINSKTQTEVEIIDYDGYTYTLKEIQENYLPELKEKKKKSKGRPKKVVSLFNEYSLYHARLNDLIKICELRSYDMEGCREVTLFLYRYFTCCFMEDEVQALECTLELNKCFVKPLSDNEVVKHTKSAETAYKVKKYKFKNSTLIDLLGITEEEQKYLKTIIGKKEANEREKEAKKLARRNENGLTNREQEKQYRISKILELKNKGLNQSEIARDIGISRQAVSKLLKSL
ncbi:winged helix-turn-helix domain-containing protein [Clostridioides difficile]|uniref:winged helix-turn-helix domain-containing protein n=3 Tax=Clostridioides difficile TaxID=1496 RepID=UPI0008264F80|nr:winged helix-turn-helix domain-containing protein [Clostridioides difficile]MDB3201844.1 ArsR family transcriptional regulator [Clostridioides difficile]MDB3597554.1 ArsR family transcriptional regulator [Clostridioides difficile]MDO0136819.1 winged helix-turn-helix domain-containing protein [Clostridioides difficile]MEC5403882.1 winged helix-turn-helix domain-containing protein [Clostridioides difficile]HBF3898187.1 MarR family transcriptional regulator [Clostridioides difficile]